MADGTGCCKDKKVSVVVYLLVGIFGIGSWLAINGLWVELPLLVPRLPEGWDLPSYLVVIIQLANIGPIAYTIASKLSNGRVSEVSIVYVIVVVGSAACLLLALFWSRTSFLGGVPHSTALLVLAFSLALVDCTSSVVFLPYMAVFKPEYMTGLYIGEGFSGLIPSVVALVQGAGGNVDCVNTTVAFFNLTKQNETLGNITEFVLSPAAKEPLFSVEVFFFFLFVMMVLCGSAFTCLNYLPYCRREHNKLRTFLGETIENRAESSSDGDDHLSDKRRKISDGSGRRVKPLPTSTNESDSADSKTELLPSATVPTIGGLSRFYYILLLLVNGWINALGNGVLPSIQSYSCLPYGMMTYHLTVTLANISNPVACFVAFLSPTKSKKVVVILTITSSCFAVYVLVLASMSPRPILQTNVVGKILVVACWIALTSLFSYTKATIACIFRSEGRKALLYCGGTTQAGSACGALVSFLLVNIFHLFHSLPPCST